MHSFESSHSPYTSSRALFFHLRGNTFKEEHFYCVLVFIHIYIHNLQSPVLVALLAVAIEDKDRQSGVLLQVLLVQTKSLMRVPAKHKNVSSFFLFANNRNLPYFPHPFDHPIVQIWHLLSKIPDTDL